MKYDQASDIMHDGISKARAFLTIGMDQEKGSPLHEEMKQAALESLAWANDDEVIDALYDEDLRNSD